jgi:hypothetical protein
MGLLSKMLEGSGVGVDVQLGPVDPTGQNQNVQVVLHSKSEPKVVTNVTLKVVCEETVENRQVMMTEDQVVGGTQQGQTESFSTLYSADNPVQMQLLPGQPIALNLQIPGIDAIINSAGSFSTRYIGEVGGSPRTYLVQAHATVDGSHHHPNSSTRLPV